jgi:asparagine synthase (glutamine-hydrolysing)
MTCSIGFDEQEFNELPQARAVAQSFHTSHQEQVVRAEPAKILHKLAGFYDQPFPDHSCIPTYYVSQLARQRVKVVLSGDGGDENFAGYSRYRRQVALNRIRRFMPHALLQPFKRFTGNRETGALPHRLARVLHQAAIGARDGYLHGITIADARLRNRIFSSDLKRELVGYDPHDRYRAIYDQAPGLDPLSKIFYLDLKTYLVDDILTKVDRASMANSLEVRVPILDHRVVEFAYSLPLHLKLRDGQGKFLLRNTVRHLLPKELLTRKKMGFRIPLVPWMQGELRSWAEEILMGDSAAAPFLDRAGTAQVWEWFQQGRIHLGDVLGVMLSFSLSSGTWAPGVQSQAASEKLPLLQM